MAKILKVTIKNDDVYSFVDCKNLEETLLKENYPKMEVIVEDGTADEE